MVAVAGMAVLVNQNVIENADRKECEVRVQQNPPGTGVAAPASRHGQDANLGTGQVMGREERGQAGQAGQSLLAELNAKPGP